MTIVTIIKRFSVTVGATAALAAPFAATAQSGTSGEAIAVRVPAELCTVDARYRTNLYTQLAGRSDFGALLDHMFENCPELALGLADFGTAETIDTPSDRRGEDRTGNLPGPDRGPNPPKDPGDKDPDDEGPGDEGPGDEGPGDEGPGEEEPGDGDQKDEPTAEDEEREERARDEREREERAREERRDREERREEEERHEEEEREERR